MKSKLLVFLISVSSLNILNYSYNISLIDIFPKLRADEATLSTLLFKHPKTGFSILLMKGDQISLDTYQGLYEEFIFEYYDEKEGKIIISKESNQYSAPLDEINYIHINPSEKNVLRATALIAGGGYLGVGVGFMGGCLAYDTSTFTGSASSMGDALGMGVLGASMGAIAGSVIGLQIEKGILRKKKSVKIKLSGKNAWKVNSIVIPLN